MRVNLHLVSEVGSREGKSTFGIRWNSMRVKLHLVSEVGSHDRISTFGVRSGITCG